MTSKEEKELDKVIQGQLQRQFTRGLSQGCKAMCDVILKKAEIADGTNDATVIKDIIDFCKVSLGLPEQK